MKVLIDVLKEVSDVCHQVDDTQIEQLIQSILNSKRIFIYGEGRSGLVAKCFAMRLMHIGYNVFVIGETITPSMKEGDLCILISGSGKSESVLMYASKAKKSNIEIFAISAQLNSELFQRTAFRLIVPGKTKGNEIPSIQLLSSLFDQALHLVLDAVALEISKNMNIEEHVALNNHF
ncbi:6-phospho-3-hexuloisomerase [Erysipelotrichaceae bacterium HCN-30851]